MMLENYWSDSLEINKQIGNIENEEKILGNLGTSYFNVFDYDSAIVMYNRARKYCGHT